MADITIDSTTHNAQAHGRHGPVWTSPTTAYIFYRDSGGDFVYRKTTNGGLTFNSAIAVSTGSEVPAFSVWFDKWTPSDTGTIIHIAWGGSSFIRYRQLDTSDDSLGSVVDVRTAASGSPGYLSIVKTQSGYLYTVDGSSNSATFSIGFMRSTDNGASWTSRATDGDMTTNVGDDARLIPTNTGDNNDCAMLFFDTSDDRLELKIYDDSANTWSEIGMASTGLNNYFEITIRHADNEVYFAWVEDVGGTDTLKFRHSDGTGPGTSAVVDIDTLNNPGTVSILYDQNSDTIYVAVAEDTTNRNIYYYTSTDDGATWSSATQYNVTADNLFYVNAGISVGITGGRFLVIWQNADLDDWLTNFDNSIEILGTSTPTLFSSIGGGGNYQVLVDWGGDGGFDESEEDITNDVQKILPLQRRDLASEYMRAKTVDITVDNNDHKYSPPNSNSDIIVAHGAGAIAPGRAVWIRYFYPFDSFTDAAGTDLDAHTPDNDSSWSWVSPVSARKFDVASSGTEVECDGTGADDFLGYMEFNDSDVTIASNIKAGSIGGEPGLLFRFADTDNYLYTRMKTSSNELTLSKNIGGTDTIIQTKNLSDSDVNITWASGEIHFMVVQLHGTSVRVYVDNALAIDQTINESAVNTATKHGLICFGSNSTDSTWNDFGGFKSLFFGELDDVVVQARPGGNHTAVLKCIDSFERLRATKLRFANTLQTSGSVASGTMAGEILTAAEFPSNSRILDTGVSILDDVDDGLKAIDDDALTALQKLQEEEDGLIYIDGMGYFRFEGRTHRSTAPHATPKVTIQDTIDASQVKMAFANINWSDGRDHIENVILIKIQKLKSGTAKTVVWRHPEALTAQPSGTDDSTLSFSASQTRDFLAHISDDLANIQTTGGIEAADTWVIPDVRTPPSSTPTTYLVAAAASESGAEWTDESNVFASDDSRAIYNNTTQSKLQVTNWNVGSVPSTATIIGIIVYVEGHGDSGTSNERNIDLQLTKDGSTGVGDVKTVELDQSTDGTEAAGTSGDTWNAGLTPADMNTNFGVLINKNTATANQIEIDHVYMEIFYADDIIANEQADNGGADRTADLTVTLEDENKYAGKWRKIRVVMGPDDAFITKLQLRATPRLRIDEGTTNLTLDPSQVEEEDAASITAYGERRKEIEAKFIHRYSTARTLATTRRDRRKDPKTELILTFTPNDRATLSNLIQRQISDLVTVNYSDMGISENFYLESEQWEISHVKNRLIVKWQLRAD